MAKNTVKQFHILFGEDLMSFLDKKVEELKKNKDFTGNRSVAAYVRSVIRAEMERDTSLRGVSNEQEIVNTLISSS